jgi:phosphinothricin acetyltransferase
MLADASLKGGVRRHSISAMKQVLVRPAKRDDLPRLTAIYNHYVIHTPITFDLEPYTVEKRLSWFEQFGLRGRHRLVVAEEDGVVLGYAGTTGFRAKPAYDTTVETTIYCDPRSTRQGLGSILYSYLFEAIANEDVHHLVAGFTLPNAASEALHDRFRFTRVGIFHQVGRKFGRYWDVAWTERPLRLPC